MTSKPYPRWLSRLFVAALTGLGLTGMLQLPLARRYYLTDVPGMAWTGDFYFVHQLHYLFAALLLFVVGVVAVNWWLDWRDKLELTRMGVIRAVILAGVVVSGGFRVYRNLPHVTLDPMLVLTIEWVHLGLAMALGVAALTALFRKASAYARYK